MPWARKGAAMWKASVRQRCESLRRIVQIFGSAQEQLQVLCIFAASLHIRLVCLQELPAKALGQALYFALKMPTEAVIPVAKEVSDGQGVLS